MSSTACSLRCTLADQSLIERICAIENAPVLSSQYRRLSEIISREAVDLVQFIAIIEERPAFTAKLLKLANSAYYARPVRCDSVEAVIEVMGVKGTVDTVLTLELVKAFGLPKSLDIERFWDHAVAVAALSKELARFNDLDGDSAYTLGLLHDIGFLQMARCAPADFRFLMSQVGPQNTAYEMMPRLYGISHLDLSIALIEHWGFEFRLREPLRMIEDSKGYREVEIGQLSLLLRQAHTIAHENRYAFCWDRLPALSSNAPFRIPEHHDFASGIGAALLACCYK